MNRPDKARLSSTSRLSGNRIPPRKQQIIIDTLRGEIVSGTLAVGGRMPSHFDIARRFGVSRVTAQWALRHLCQEGFIRTRARSGTFVAKEPPHLNRYALVFWNDPQQPWQWSKYYAALTDAARHLDREEGRRFVVFHNIDRHVDTEEYQQLHALVVTHRLAGMIFVNPVEGMMDSPLATEPGIPRVALTRLTAPGIMGFSYDAKMWVRKALDYLRERGRKRVAVLSANSFLERDTGFSSLVAERGMICPLYWHQILYPMLPMTADRCVQLLMQGASGTRPDALLILDDNMVEDASAGMIAAGVRVPEDVEVVAHANYPLASRAVLPMCRLGFDVLEVLRKATDLIDRQRQGETVEELTEIRPKFESELMPSVAGASIGGKQETTAVGARA